MVVVGIDGSDAAQHAPAWAADEPRLRGTWLTVVHGYQIPQVGAYPYTTMSIDPTLMPKAARRLLHTAFEVTDTTSLDVTPVASPGGAAHAILDSAAEADLVVVGVRGLGTVQRLLLGPVATQVVHHGPGPVAVILSTDR